MSMKKKAITLGIIPPPFFRTSDFTGRALCDIWFSMYLSPSSYNLFKAHTLLTKKSCRSKHDSWHHKNKETRLLEQNQEAKLMKSLQVLSGLMKISVRCMNWVKRGWNKREAGKTDENQGLKKAQEADDLGFPTRNSAMHLELMKKPLMMASNHETG